MMNNGQPVNWRDLLDRIAVAIDKADRKGSSIRVTETAELLQRECAPSLPLAEIEGKIVRMATNAEVGVDLTET